VPAPLRFAVLICAALAACGDGALQDNECQVSALKYRGTLMPTAVSSLARDLPPRTGELRVLETCSHERRHARAAAGAPAPPVRLRPPARRDLTSGRRCHPVAFAAKVVRVWSDGLLTDPDKRAVRVEARTVVDGPVLDGVPRIATGAGVRIRALRCNGRRAPVARRITVR
jgi:hypothetical protein